MSQTGHERPGRPGQDVPAADVPAADVPAQGAPTAGSPDTPAAPPSPDVPAAGAGAADPDRLPAPAGPPASVPWPADPGDLLTDGVVELRKRGGPTPHEAAGEAAHPLETVARQAAERVAAERRPRG
ncbi:hypothetical protein [Streptomyces sp. NPDC090445]|uniref:hypothetical protein n=1 Tax=Streptomyces sp. NPDC090445 TaxID=3365963 RepID=UPI00381BB486